jgi:hypothetical protein
MYTTSSIYICVLFQEMNHCKSNLRKCLKDKHLQSALRAASSNVKVDISSHMPEAHGSMKSLHTWKVSFTLQEHIYFIYLTMLSITEII